MILLDLKNYIRQKGTCNLQQLCLHFQCDSVVLQDMLAHWLRKGVIVEIEKPSGCGTRCIQCQPELVRLYQYAGNVSVLAQDNRF